MIIEGNKITPDEGKWLYNGEVCSQLVYLGKGASADEWTEVDEYIESAEDEAAYTEERLSAMSNAELQAILADMGISGSMTKANMIALILDKQNSNFL